MVIELTYDQKVEFGFKTYIYGTAFALQYKDGSIEILGLGEIIDD